MQICKNCFINNLIVSHHIPYFQFRHCKLKKQNIFHMQKKTLPSIDFFFGGGDDCTVSWLIAYKELINHHHKGM